ncbi:MAG: hypothetical protein AAFZ15_10135 [Bacteroidota bacterium]
MLEKTGAAIYVYCTDFIINLANMLGLSYYEVNALIFCFAYPVLIILLIVLYFFQKRRWKKLNKASH